VSRQNRSRFGALLKTLRTAADLTQEALAERAGLSVRGLQDLERGQSQRPHQETVELLATALELAGPDRARFVGEARGQLHDSAPHAATPQLFSAGALVPLVGREPELALLDHFLNGGEEPLGPAPVLLLAGEPGIGKTRLLQAAAQHAIARGWSVLVGGCHRRGGQDPYAPVLDALAQHLQAAGPARQRAVLAGCGWLVRLLPELAEILEPVPAGTLPPDQERRLMVAAVGRVLANMAGPAGTLLVLDDLQWASADALDLLAILLRTSTPVRIVGAYRDTEVRPSDPLGLLIADLAQAGQVRQHALGPLGTKDAADLLDNLLVDLAAQDSDFVDGVLQRAGGTPFYLISYAQALRQGSTAAVPWDIEQGIRQRVALLAPESQELLEVAAVAGRSSPRALLVAAAGQPEEAALSALDAACRSRLLLEAGEDAYAFAHDLIWEIIEADLSAARRVLLHRRVAEALERSPGLASLDTLAYHCLRAGMHEQAATYLEEAGDQASARYAHAAAKRSYRAAIEQLEEPGHAAAIRVREKLGGVLHHAGRYAEAVLLLEETSGAYRSAGNVEGEARATAAAAQAHLMSGAGATGIARITALLARLEGSDSLPALASLYSVLGKLLLTAGGYLEAATATQRTAELASELGDDRTRLLAGYNQMHVLLKLGRMDEAMQVAAEVLHLAEELHDLRTLAGMHRDLAYTLAAQGEFETARRHIDQACMVARETEGPGELMVSVAIRGWLAFLRGEWPEARADLEQAVALNGENDWSWLAAYPLLFLAHLSLAEEDRTAAAATARDALALAEQTGDLQGIRWTSAVLAELDILQGRVEAAIGRLVPLLDRPGMMESDVTDFLPVLAWAYIEEGSLVRAGEVVAQSLERARAENARLILVEALRVQALLALRRKEWQVASRSLQEGLELARGMPWPYAAAKLRHLTGLLPAEEHLSGAGSRPESTRDESRNYSTRS
jgi:tetratricopeptide (TPR) repeat protein